MSEDKKQQEAKSFSASEFSKRFLNNKTVVALIILLLALICIYMLSKMQFLFKPLRIIIETIGTPVIITIILYFLLVPVVNRLEKMGINRSLGIIVLFVIIFALLVWGIVSLVPVLTDQIKSLVKNIPGYAEDIRKLINKIPYNEKTSAVIESLLGIGDHFDVNAITQRVTELLNTAFGGISNVVGTVASFVTGLLIVPIMLFYMLRDSEEIPKKILYYVPTKNRPILSRIMYQSNYQIAQYIRGQIIVALCVGTMFTIGYSIIGLDYALTLGILGGILNLVPYVGSIIAAIPAIILGIIDSPAMVVKVLIVIFVEQTIEGRIISPQVIGSNMEIHPVTILVILLVGGNIFGIVGVIAGVPMYAVIKVVFTEIYNYYRDKSDQFGPVEEPPEVLSVDDMLKTDKD